MDNLFVTPRKRLIEPHFGSNGLHAAAAKEKRSKVRSNPWLAEKGDGFPLTVYLQINVKNEISDEPKGSVRF